MNSKSIRIAVAALLISGAGSLCAQEAVPVESVAFTGGKVLIPQDGKSVEATNDVTLPGGVYVATNGVFTVNKGKERQLQEGQSIDADGMLTSADGSVAPVANHLVLKGGRVQLVKDGAGTSVSDYTLPDGSRVSADGTIRGHDGRLRRLLDGQLLTLDGKAVPTTDTVSFKNGKVVLFKDGGKVELRKGQAIAMSDGTRVTGDGTVTRPDGTKISIKEGEILKISGVVAPRR
jgi:hypothetical protein